MKALSSKLSQLLRAGSADLIKLDHCWQTLKPSLDACFLCTQRPGRHLKWYTPGCGVKGSPGSACMCAQACA